MGGRQCQQIPLVIDGRYPGRSQGRKQRREFLRKIGKLLRKRSWVRSQMHEDMPVPNAGGDFVQGNLIGTDRTGTLPLGNSIVLTGFAGVFVGEANVLIGGLQPGAGNVISANGSTGIDLEFVAGSEPSGIVIEGNFIGTDVSGKSALGNRVGVNINDGDGIRARWALVRS